MENAATPNLTHACLFDLNIDRVVNPEHRCIEPRWGS